MKHSDLHPPKVDLFLSDVRFLLMDNEFTSEFHRRSPDLLVSLRSWYYTCLKRGFKPFGYTANIDLLQEFHVNNLFADVYKPDND